MRLIVLAALSAAVGLGAYLVINGPPGPPPPPAPRPDDGALRFDPAAARQPDSADPSLPSALGVPVGTDASSLLLLRKDDRPLQGEPAGLPSHPGPDAVRQSGFQRRAGGFDEQFAFWLVQADAPANALAFYDRAALESGFKPLGRPINPAGGRRVTKIYVRPVGEPAVTQRLTISAATTRDGVRIVLWSSQPTTASR